MGTPLETFVLGLVWCYPWFNIFQLHLSNMKCRQREDGSINSAVGILILAVLFGLLIFLLLIAPGFISGVRIGSSLSNVPYPPVVAENITGYADLSGNIAGIPVSNPDPNPERLGAVIIPIKLQYFTSSAKGPAAIDMSKTIILFTVDGKTEELSRSDTRPVTKPSWTVV